MATCPLTLADSLQRVLADDAVRERLYYYLDCYSSGISEVSVDAPNQIFITENSVKIPLSRHPETLTKMVIYLTTLFDPVRPDFVLIDDLCASFHPDLHSILVDIIEEASEWTHIVATTHSKIVLDALTNKPEFFYITEKDLHGYTQITQLDPKELAPWLEKYSLGDLWVSGHIGGNRW